MDLFICPTRHSFNGVKSEGLPAAHFPWPSDTARFPFRQRRTVRRFLFINGTGGYKNRKGGDVIRRLVEYWPEIPLTIISQSKEEWPRGRNIIVKDAFAPDMYDSSIADVLLYPSRVDGLGLGVFEALSSGMPIVATGGEPWNEAPAAGRIRADHNQKRPGQYVSRYEPDARSLLEICKNLLGKDITLASLEARTFAEGRSFRLKGQSYEQSGGAALMRLIQSGSCDCGAT